MTILRPVWLFPLALTCVFFALPFRAAAHNWPNWRGPHSNGTTAERNLPLSWDRTNNVAWRVELPGPGNSSPIVWSNRVFITQAMGNRRTLWCLDRTDGKILWQAGPTYDQPEETYTEGNPYCTASPVTDGERVIAFFGSAGLYAYDFHGRELWQTNLGKISHIIGSGSSPTLGSNLCYVFVGPGKNESMVAVDKRTGQVAWRTDAIRPDADEAKQIKTNGPPAGTWSTPVLVDNGGRTELLMAFAFRLGAFDPQSGNLLWQQPGLGLQTYVTPLFTDGMILATAGTTTHGIKPPTKRRADPEKVWTQEKGKFRFSSPVATDTHLFYLAENGLAECWEKTTGRVLWQERLQGPGAKKTTWSSPSKAGNRIYAPNQSGDIFVFAAEPTFRILSTNSVAESSNTTLALAQGSILFRTDKALWCFRETNQQQSGKSTKAISTL